MKTFTDINGNERFRVAESTRYTGHWEVKEWIGNPKNIYGSNEQVLRRIAVFPTRKQANASVYARLRKINKNLNQN